MRNPNARIPDPRSFFSCPGSRVHIIYEGRFNGRTMSLVEVGREEIQPKIDAYAPYTDLVYMLSRLKVNDFSVMASRTPMYGDFSGLPTNPIDAINLVQSAQNAFGRLSVDEKQKYNNDYRVWLASVLSAGQSSSVAAGEPVSIDSVKNEPAKEPAKDPEPASKEVKPNES